LHSSAISSTIIAGARVPIDVYGNPGDYLAREESAMIELPQYALLAIATKERFVAIDQQSHREGDGEPMVLEGMLPPTIMVEQDGQVSVIVHYRGETPFHALGVVHLLHSMMDYQAIIFAHEVRMRKVERAEATRRMADYYQYGAYRNQAEQGTAAEHGIMDAIVVHRFEGADETDTAYSFPFVYPGPTAPLTWLADSFDHFDSQAMYVAPDLPSAVRQVLRSPKAEEVGRKVAPGAARIIDRMSPYRTGKMKARAVLEYIDEGLPDAMLLVASHTWEELAK
jgi:hypothetical protein